MRILIHDINDLDAEIFNKFKDLTLLNKNTAKEYMKEHWHMITDIFDATTKHEFYNNIKKENIENIFKADY